MRREIVHREEAFGTGLMRQSMARQAIANGCEMRLVREQRLVHGDASIGLDPEPLKPKTLTVWTLANRDQASLSRQGRPGGQRHPNPVRSSGQRLDRGLRQDGDPPLLQRSHQHPDGFWIFHRQELGLLLHNRHRHAETRKTGGELAANHPAPDDQQGSRKRWKVQEIPIRQERVVIKRPGTGAGACARGDDHALSRQRNIVAVLADVQRMRIIEGGFPSNELNLMMPKKRNQSLSKLGDDSLIAGEESWVIEVQALYREPVACRLANAAKQLGHSDERFRRDAPDIQTHPAKLGPLDEHDPQPSAARRQGCRMTAGAAANNGQITMAIHQWKVKSGKLKVERGLLFKKIEGWEDCIPEETSSFFNLQRSTLFTFHFTLSTS